MKHLIRVFVLLLLLTLFITPTLANGDTFLVTARQANVRSGPGIEYEVIGQLRSGHGFPIVAYSPTGNWVQLDINGSQGWVFRHLGTVHSTVITAPVVVPSQPTTTYQAPTYTLPVVTHTSGVGIVDSNTINSTVGVLASVNMRRDPSLYSGILAIIPYGKRATPLARTADATWILVEYKDMTGWVYHRLVAFPPNLSVVSLPVQ